MNFLEPKALIIAVVVARSSARLGEERTESGICRGMSVFHDRIWLSEDQIGVYDYYSCA